MVSCYTVAVLCAWCAVLSRKLSSSAKSARWICMEKALFWIITQGQNYNRTCVGKEKTHGQIVSKHFKQINYFSSNSTYFPVLLKYYTYKVLKLQGFRFLN
jgi:hypothetical protein